MQYSSDICFMCLKKDTTIKDYKNDIKYSTEIIHFVLPELINKDFGLPCICAPCYDICKVFHKFKRICIENYSHWKEYIIHSQKIELDVNKNEDDTKKIASEHSDIIIKQEIFEEESVPLEPAAHIKIENILEYNEDTTDPQINHLNDNQNISQNNMCKFGENGFINNEDQKENQLFQISSIFSNADSYLQQLEIHNKTDDSQDSLLVIKEKPTSTRKGNKKKRSSLQCSVCNIEFPQYRSLKRHMLIHKDKYQCQQCDKEFKHKYLLSRHLSVHLDKKEHECLICNKIYRLKYSLNNHMKSHRGGEIKCKVCSKVFLHLDYLKKHMKLHSGVKEHKCPHCREEFVYYSYLKSHIKTKHSNAQNF